MIISDADPTAAELRIGAAATFTEVTGRLLRPVGEARDAIADGSLMPLVRIAFAAAAVAETLMVRDERAAYERAGIVEQCPDRMPEILPEDAEFIADAVDSMLEAAVTRACRARVAARKASGGQA